MDLSVYKKVFSFNKKQIPVNCLSSVEEFNAAIDELNNQGFKFGIKFTQYHNISSRGHVPFAYDIVEYSGSMAGWQIWIYSEEGSYILQFNPTLNKDGMIVGHDVNKKGGTYALNTFTRELKKKCKINLVDYALIGDDAIKAKESIPKALIGPVNDFYVARTLEHCYHLDINSAYPAGLKEAYPEFGPVIDDFYNKKKNSATKEEREDYKLILNSLIGKMQSETIHYQYAHMSKAAIEYCRNKLLQMKNYLAQQCCSVVMFNTDGLWFIPMNNQLPKIPNLGDEMGQWKLDHKDCTLCMKNANYEYIEDGKYTPVVRGKTKLDQIKPRSEWQWGDIFRNEVDKTLKIRLDLSTHKLIWIEEETMQGDENYVKETIQ